MKELSERLLPLETWTFWNWNLEQIKHILMENISLFLKIESKSKQQYAKIQKSFVRTIGYVHVHFVRVVNIYVHVTQTLTKVHVFLFVCLFVFFFLGSVPKSGQAPNGAWTEILPIQQLSNSEFTTLPH